MNASNRERPHSNLVQSSRRSLLSESESDVGSLLSGLSKARKIPDRRKLSRKDSGTGGSRSAPKYSSNRVSKSRRTKDISTLKQKNEIYKKEVVKIIKLQAFARGYIVRFAYKSRMTMEKTKRRFFAIQLQAYTRGFLQRERYRKMTGKEKMKRKLAPPKIRKTLRAGLGSPPETVVSRSKALSTIAQTSKVVGPLMDDDSERSEISFRSEAGSVMSNLSRLSQARRIPDRRKKGNGAGANVVSLQAMESSNSHGRRVRRSSTNTADELGDGESQVGSVTSNISRLSQARRLPDRRPIWGGKEQKVVSLQGMDCVHSNPWNGRQISMNTADELGDSGSVVDSVTSNLSRLSQARRIPDRRRKVEEEEGKLFSLQGMERLSSNARSRRRASVNTADEFVDSESLVGSVMSNLSRLSQARRIPNRRRKAEEKEGKRINLQGMERLDPQPLGGRRLSMNTSDDLGDSESQVGSVVSNISRLSQARRVPDRRRKGDEKEGRVINLQGMDSLNTNAQRGRKSFVNIEDQLGDSGSVVDSIMSNLSQLSHARKVPDRRRKGARKVAKEMKGAKEVHQAKAVKIQAIARGYMQRFRYRSMLALENTKRKYASISIQACIRGYLQRQNGPEVSRTHVAPKRELPPTSSREHCEKRRKSRHSKKETNVHGRSNKDNRLRDTNTPHKTIRKPLRHTSDSGGGDTMPPRHLTIRKPRRQTSNVEEQSHGVPVKELTIRKPRRQQSHSDCSNGAPPNQVTVSKMNSGGTKSRNHSNANTSPPRKIMLRVKRDKRPDVPVDLLDKSEESLEPEKGRMERFASQNNAPERMGESESDVGSLMSGLSQARKVPDRRLKRQLPSSRNPDGDEKINSEKQVERVESATKIQALGRGYSVRFAYQSRLILENTKKKFFAIQIQAVARGYIVRSRRLGWMAVHVGVVQSRS